MTSLLPALDLPLDKPSLAVPDAALDYQAVIDAPFGKLGILSCGDMLTALDFLPADRAVQEPDAGSVAAWAAEQLQEYFCDPAFVFTVPWRVSGTPYQQRVWQAIREIPLGELASYRELADKLSSAPRAVGGACGRNPLPIIIPCHRVVAGRSLGGFNRSSGLATRMIKQWLVQHEQWR